MLRFIALPLAVGILAAAAHSFAATTGSVSLGTAERKVPVEQAALRQLAVRPLDGSSVFALAVSRDPSGDRDDSKRLVEQAIGIDPRLRTARTWILAEAVNRGDADQAIDQALVLARLSPAAARPVSALLAQLAQDPRSRAILAGRLADDPLILAVTSEAARSGAEPTALLELVARTNLRMLTDGVVRAQSAIIGPMIRAEQYSAARRTWLKLAGLQDQPLVFDGQFRGQVGSPPFAWTVYTNANLETAIAAGSDTASSGLEATAFGSLAITVAEQALTMAPGRYTLAFSASSEDAAGKPVFVWTVSCNSNRAIAEIPVQPSDEATNQSVNIIVSAGCPMQVLRLIKLRTPDTGARTIRIERVSITRE